MADEQFPWLDYPSPHVSQNAPRVGDNPNSQWRNPFYNTTSNSNLQTPLNSSNPQSQYYPSYQQQEESYVRLEDVLPYTSYRWGPPPTREFQRQTSYPENNSDLPLPSTTISQQSPKRPTAPNRQLPAPMPQVSGESSLAKDVYSGHEAKRRRIDPPGVSQSAPPTVPQVDSSAYSEVRTQPAPQDPRFGSQCSSSNTSNTIQTANPVEQSTAQPTAQRSTYTAPRAGSQYVSPVQARSAPQGPQRNASPADSHLPAPRAYQHASQAQSRSVSRAPSNASLHTTTQHIAQGSSQQFASSNGSTHTVPQVTAHSIVQPTAERNHQSVSHFNSQSNSPATAAQSLPQTVAPSDTQIRPPPMSRLNPSPQTRPQGLPPNARQAASQSLTQRASQPTAKASPKLVSHPVARPNTQPESRPCPSTSSSRQPKQSATPPVHHSVPHLIPPRMPSSTQTASSASAPTQPIRTPSQMQLTQQSQPAHGPQKNFAAYAFRPENPTDRTQLKRRPDIVSRFNEADAAQKLTYDPKTIARDILIAASRHPTEPTLNHHLFRLRDLFTHVDVTSDLATFRWDLVDPREPSRELIAARAPMQTTQTAPPLAVQVSVNNISAPQPAVPQQHLPSQPFQQVKIPKPQPPPQPQPQPQVQIPALSHPVASPVPRPPTQAQTPSTPNTMEKKRRGRPPGSTNKPKVATAAAPGAAPAPTSFPVFACRWGNCQAELHNLEMLKKHIYKVHVSHQITCGWKGCAFTGTLPAAELMKHAKNEHLNSLAWKLGDGPTVPTSVNQGKAVPITIPGSHQPSNEDSLIFPADYRSIRAFNKVHGNHSQQEKAREIFKAVQRLKEHIGVGLDPGGCELATPLRNQRVSDEEDVYQVKSAS